MPQADPMVTYLMQRYKRMQTDRAPFENDWMDIRDLVRPVSVGYSKLTTSYISLRTEFMYDGTAPEALEELSSALHSYLSNPAERWFELQVEGQETESLESEVLDWLEFVANRIYAYYRREDACLNQALHEVYLDLGSFGTAHLSQEWDPELNGLLFSAKPTTDCYILENSIGIVDTLFRKVLWDARKVEQEFGEIPPLLAERVKKNQDEAVELLHCVFPRTDKLPYNPFRKKYASVWFVVSTLELLRQSGYDTFPYHVPRWTKLSGETYGRGPSKKCLPDIKMLNAMEKTLLKAGQKAVDPPTVFTDEGFLAPIKTSPGALIYKEAGTDDPMPLKFEGNLPWGLEQANQKREFVRQCFYADWIKMDKQNVEMTAYEVADKREEKLRLMAPILGRQTSELLGPMIKRSYNLLNDRGLIPPAPASIRGARLQLAYISQASKAQVGVLAINMGRFVQDLLPIMQINPNVLDIVDWDKFAEQMAIARGASRLVLRTPDELAQVRQQKQQVQAAQQAAQIAQPASQAVKNLADADQGGGTGGGGLQRLLGGGGQ